jgi:hypothetical protein
MRSLEANAIIGMIAANAIIGNVSDGRWGQTVDERRGAEDFLDEPLSQLPLRPGPILDQLPGSPGGLIGTWKQKERGAVGGIGKQHEFDGHEWWHRSAQACHKVRFSQNAQIW